jgi:hypothetical protein
MVCLGLYGMSRACKFALKAIEDFSVSVWMIRCILIALHACLLYLQDMEYHILAGTTKAMLVASIIMK